MNEGSSFIIIFTMHLNPTLSKKILAWYDNSKRNLPWRVSKKSPKKLYYRLLSEFMLQQTQVKTVVPYFKKFTKKYRTLESLSKANETAANKLVTAAKSGDPGAMMASLKNLGSSCKVCHRSYKD